MPQLDPTFLVSQLFWLAITFVVLYTASSKFILPKLLGIIQDREYRISNNLETAESLRDEAVKVEAEYEKRLRDNRSKAREAIDKAKRELADEAAARHRDLDKVLQEKMQKSETEIQAAREKAYQTLADVSAELSVIVAEKCANIKTTEAKAKKAITPLIKDAS